MKRSLSKDTGQSIIFGTLGILTLLFIWYIASTFTEFGLIFPSPIEAFAGFFDAFVNPIGQHTILGHVGVSLGRVAVGYTLSAIVGTLLGLLMGYSKMAYAIINPVFSIIRPIPGIAWIPIAILWIGIGNPTIYFIIFMGGFSQMVMNTMAGAQHVNTELVGVAKVLGAKQNSIFMKIVLPSTVPYIFTGLQTSLATSWMAVLAAEMITTTEGVGWLILAGMQNGNMVTNLVGMISIGIVGMILAVLIRNAEGRLCKWSKRG